MRQYADYASRAQLSEADTLSYDGGAFHLGPITPTIYFESEVVRIGCKSITARAMDELCSKWQEFRSKPKRVVIQP